MEINTAEIKKKSVVITGANGFIGSHLAPYLEKCGYNVYAIVSSKSDLNKIDGNINYYKSNIENFSDIIDFLPRNPEALFDFSWAGVSPCFRNDITLQLKNIELTKKIIELASQIEAKKFVFPGSTMEYSFYGKPIGKDAIPSPVNAYSVAKLSARYLSEFMCSQYKIPFVYVVIAGIYSEDRKDDNIIYYTITQLLHNERPSFTSLQQLWDYVHIDDVVYGLRLIIENGKSGAFYSLGHGDNWPLYNYIYKIRDLIDKNAPLGIGDKEFEMKKMPSSCIDLADIYSDTGYIPKVTFDDGIRRVIDAIKSSI